MQDGWMPWLHRGDRRGGKQASTAVLQDEVTGALVALARTVRAAGMNGTRGERRTILRWKVCSLR